MDPSSQTEPPQLWEPFPLSSGKGGITSPEEDTLALRNLESFSRAYHQWGNGIEGAIEEAYRSCFKTYVIHGRFFTLSLPFAENNERSELAPRLLTIQGGGKTSPVAIWQEIDKLLISDDFNRYLRILQDKREKVIIFDLASRRWTWTEDLYEIARMKARSYKGLPHRPYVLVHGEEVTLPDIYNYIYCIGRVGIDCSGFVWYILTTVTQQVGINLTEAVRRSLRPLRITDPTLYIGTWFFDSKNPEIEAISDRIENVAAGDIILFRGANGQAVHSAIIQSINIEKGQIRYLQSTDEAPLEERGVHESFIYFSPKQRNLSLKDPSLIWTQKRYAPFPGEFSSPFSDDGERYRAYPEFGGGRVVRLKSLKKVKELLEKRKSPSGK
ncbi:MAG: peptidoglycan endopeptidase [Treponemataceae bacterium]|nr:peptidoglycan endopeptidase [Treponemataceae bacterium]